MSGTKQQRSAPLPPKATAEPPPPMWVALWDYAAQDESELNMAEGEQVTVKNKGNGEGWWLAVSATGKVRQRRRYLPQPR